jgi:diguanylate cyclase (GGDEF)-like protein/PAS domain S-box-containing protein
MVDRQEINGIVEGRAFEATFDQAPIGLAHLDLDGRWRRVNPRLVALIERPAAALFGTQASVLFPHLATRIRDCLGGPARTCLDEREVARSDGSAIWVEFSLHLVLGDDGAAQFFVLALTDITARRHAEEDWRLSAAVFSNTREGVVITDCDGRILTVNPAFTAITGYEPGELIGLSMRLLQSGRHDRAFYDALWHAVRVTGYWQGEIWNRRKNGDVYPELLTISTVRDESGGIVNYVGTFSDITTWKRSQQRMEHLAHHDALTGLPNRLMLLSRLEHAVAKARRDQGQGAVLFLDLDRFKQVNDTLGHPSGDSLLVAVAKRLRERLRDSDTLARLGGDEFVIVLEQLSEANQAAALARVLIARLSEPFELPGGHVARIGASIGISLFPADGTAPDELIKQADLALYQAKQGGRGIYRFSRNSTDSTGAA